MSSRTIRAFPIAILLLALRPSPATSAPIVQMGGEIHVNVSPLADYSGPSVAVFPDGGFVVVWTVGPKEGRKEIHARLFDKAGKPSGGEFLLTDRAAASQVADRVAADRDGSFLLAWTEDKSPPATDATDATDTTDVFIRRFNRDGTPRGARFQANPPSASSRHGGVLALGRDGRIAVAWTKDIDLPDDGSYSNSAARIFTAAGFPVSKELTIGLGETGLGDDNNYSSPTGLALGADGSLTVLTQNHISPGYQETWLYRLSADSERPIWTPFNHPYAPFPAPGSWLAMDPRGGLTVVWSEYDVLARRFAPSGAPLGKVLLVSKKPAELSQLYPAVALLPEGGFVVVWTDTEQRDGNGWGLFGRAFTTGGAPASGDLRINVTTAGNQYAPAIAAGDKGPVVVVWSQLTGDIQHGKKDIFARILSPAIP
jgi:hypothetical protein